MKVDHSSGIEIRHLAALEAVAEEGSFRRAAARLGYVQSAISEQIASLERIVGRRLVERSPGAGGVRLTEAGEVLLGHGRAILARVKAAEADLSALTDGSAGTLKLGIYQSVGIRILPQLLQRYAVDWPAVRVLPQESATDAGLFDLVEKRRARAVVRRSPAPRGPVRVGRDHARPVCAARPGRLPARREEERRAGRRRRAPADRHTRHAGCSRASRPSCARRASEPNIVFRSDIIGTVQALVAAGVGIAIVPRLAVDPGDERTRMIAARRRNAGPAPHDRALLAPRPAPSAAALGFVQAAKAICKQVTAELDGKVRPSFADPDRPDPE